jgi:RNA polymerase sigma-70 factor, ECF subfamily
MGANLKDLNALKRSISAPREGVDGRLSPREQARLVRAARQGDGPAMRRLLTVLSGPIYRFGRGFCRDPHDAEDVMQDVLTALARGLAAFRGDASLTSWAYTVARRACMRHRRKRAAEPDRMASLDAGAEAAEAAALVDRGADPQRRLERRELAALLERSIAALPAPQREVLLLRDVEGLSAREVGRALGLGERAVKSRLHRARLALRVTLAPYLESAPDRGSRPRAAASPTPSPRCAETARLVSRFLEGELTAERCAVLSRHVRQCPDCTAQCETLRAALSACHAWGGRAAPPRVRDRLREALRPAPDGA